MPRKIRTGSDRPVTRRDATLGAGLAVATVTADSSGAATKTGEVELTLTRAGEPLAQIIIPARPAPVALDALPVDPAKGWIVVVEGENKERLRHKVETC